MKKIFTMLLGVAALLAAMPVRAEVVTVSSKTDFENFFFKERTNDQSDTIYVKTDGSVLNLYNKNKMVLPNCGKIHIIGIDNEETGKKSGIAIQWDLPLNSESDLFSLFFENLIIEVNGGRLADSKYFIQTKDSMYHYLDTLSMVNCEITNYNRGIYRVQPAEKKDKTKDAGDVNYVGIEGCTIHAGYLANNNPMSLFRMDMRVAEMVFRNNLFYDLGYLHSLVQFATMTEEVGRVDINFICENNLFIGWNSQNSLMMFDEFVGQLSEFHINNNLFIVPDWKDDYNNADIPADSLITHPDTLTNRPQHYIASIQYGQVECKNNVLVGYKKPRVSLDKEGEGAWLSADTVYITPEEAGYDKSIFLDFANRDFRYLSTQKMATAGSDGGPIGPKQLVLKYDNPCYLTVTSTTTGVTFEPTNGVYDKGMEVSVLAKNRPGAYFQYWTIGGEQVSTANPYVFTIQGDVQLVAVYEEKPVAVVTLTLDAPENVEMSISPVQEDYFVGDSITVTFNSHYWADFDKWSDGVTAMNRGFRLTGDITLTAKFKQSDRIAVWDFDQVTKGKQTLENGVGANHFVNGDSAYIGSLHTAYFVNEAYKDSATIMTRNNKFSGDIRICAVRETPADRFAATPDYNYIVLNVAGYKDIKVSSLVGADAKAHKKQLLQYSVDGLAWETFGSVELDTIGAWFELAGSLPAAAITADTTVCIRWIGDTASAPIAHPDNLPIISTISEFSCVAGIAVKGTKNVKKPENGYYVSVGEVITDGMQITSVKDITMTYGGAANNWGAGKADASLSNATNGIFDALTAGDGNNPKDANNKGYSSDKKNVPTTGTFYVFAPAKAGKLEVAVCLNSGKNFFITEDSVALADYNGITVSEKYYGTYTIDVKAGSTYYVFCTGSKLGFGGFIFTPATGMNIEKSVKTQVFANSGDLFVVLPAEAPVTVYNLLGQTVKSLEASQGENVITGLSSGIYLVRVADQIVKVKL